MATEKETREVEIILNGQKANASLKELAAAAALMTNQLSKMAQDDPRRAALLGDFQQIKQRVAAARAEMNTYVKTEAELREETEKLNRANQLVILNGQRVTSSFKEMREAGALLERQLHEISADDPTRGKMLADYQALQKRIHEVGQEIKGLKPGLDEAGQSGGFFKNAMSNALGVFTGGGALEIVSQVGSIGKSIFETTAKFEKVEAVLTTALGDKSAAQQAMAQIQDMAAKTPFSVQELTDSYLKFVNRGLVPSMAEMKKMADLAASQGKSFEQLTEAVLDAGTGEFERLKEFGIQASKSGDQVSLSFKGIQKTVANTPEAINKALMGFGELNGVMGATDSISKTLEGQMSNLGDATDQLENEVGQQLKPAFVALITVAFQFLGFLRNSKGPFTEFINYFIKLYSESAGVRLAVNALIFSFQNATSVIKNSVGLIVDDFIALGKVVKGVFTLDFNLIEQGYRAMGKNLVDRVKRIASDVGTNYKEGIERTMSADKVGLLGVSEKEAQGAVDSVEKAAERVGAAAKKKAASDALKKLNEQALAEEVNRLKIRLTQVAEGSAQELALRKQLLDAEARAEMEGEKKSASDKQLIWAEAQQKKRELSEKYAEHTSTAQKKADQEHLNQLKAQSKEEEDHLKMTWGQMADGRNKQRAKVMLEAEMQYRDLTGLEENYTELVAGIVEGRDLKLRELAAKFAEQDEAERQKKVEAQITQNQVLEEERLAQLEIDLINGVLSEQAYQDAVYAVKMAAAARELELIKQKSGVESAEYKKLHTHLLKEEATHNAKVKKEKDGMVQFEKGVQAVKKLIGDQEVATVGELFGKKSGLYKAFVAVQKAIALAEIAMNLQVELAANSKYAATLGPAGPIYLFATNALSLVRAGLGAAKVVSSGFYQGGRTSAGSAAAAPGQLDLAELHTDAAGKLRDGDGREVAGLVHANEYVIPEWMRADPQVARIEEFLEARRVRGYYEGGETGPAPAAAGAEGSAPGEVATLSGVVERNTAAMLQLNERLQKVEDWQRELGVELSMPDLEREIATRKQVRYSAEIR